MIRNFWNNPIDYFTIYNRWGKIVFSSNELGKGWNGSIDGKPAGTDTYVWIMKGMDIFGNNIEKKESAILIR